MGFDYPGQTEFFADAWGGEPYGLLLGGNLPVVLATWHVPLFDVAEFLTEESLTIAVKRAHLLGTKMGIKSPRIAVCGLNPHAGEQGILGMEEQEFLIPGSINCA